MKKKILAVISLAAALLCTGCNIGAGAVADENSGIPTEEQIAAVKDELGDDMKALKFSVDGKVYQYPVIMQDMQDNGWYMDNSIAKQLKTLEANTRTTSFVLRKNRDGDYGITECSVVAENAGFSEKEIGETSLAQLKFYREKGATIILPQGLTWDSTFEEVCEAYQPSDDCVTDVDGFLTILFSNDDYSGRLTIEFDSETRKIKTLQFWK